MRVERLPSLEFAKTENGGLAIYYSHLYLGRTNKKMKKVTRVMNVRQAHPYDLHKVKSTARQLGVDPLLNVCYDLKPEDAYCVLGITMEGM